LQVWAAGAKHILVSLWHLYIYKYKYNIYLYIYYIYIYIFININIFIIYLYYIYIILYYIYIINIIININIIHINIYICIITHIGSFPLFFVFLLCSPSYGSFKRFKNSAFLYRKYNNHIDLLNLLLLPSLSCK
jgi:hypothetical protein